MRFNKISYNESCIIVVEKIPMYKINPKVLNTPDSEDGTPEKMLLLEPETGMYYELNEVSTLIFMLLVNNTQEQEIIDTVVSNYDVDIEIARSDFNQLMEQLKQKKILV